jgi:hypothetical protein
LPDLPVSTPKSLDFEPALADAPLTPRAASKNLADRGGPARHPVLESKIIERRQLLARQHDL